MTPTLDSATLGGGCFWCTEAVFLCIDGVQDVIPGYAGGTTENPSYESVCSGETGHAEVVRIHFDPAVLSFGSLLTFFWEIHDPTILPRIGATALPQHRSIILAHNHIQLQHAMKSLTLAQQKFSDPILTQVRLLEKFYPAETCHRHFYQRNPGFLYSRAVIEPRVKKITTRNPTVAHPPRP